MDKECLKSRLKAGEAWMEPPGKLGNTMVQREAGSLNAGRISGCTRKESVNVLLSMNSLRRVAAGMGWGPVRAFAVCALALTVVPAYTQTSPAQTAPAASQSQAQQPASDAQQPAAETQQPAANSQQEPGAGAQVHTGTSSGIEGDARLQNLLADHQFLRLEAMLGEMTPGQAQFYRGILANRSNDLKTSIELLSPLLDQVSASGDKTHEKLLRKALAEDYLRQGDWAKAAKAYAALETRLQGTLTSDEQDEIEMPVKMLPLAAANPPMTVEPCEPFALQVTKDPLGLIDLPVYVDARPHSWMLDPTAPFNLISHSLAHEAGLRLSESSVTIHTLTGRPIVVHMTVIPRFTVGGRLTLRNMTAYVYEDADYYFPRTHYQVQGVLGFAALSALGSVTITADDTVEVQPAKQIDPAKTDDKPAAGSRFFLDGDQVIVALGNADASGAGSTPAAAASGEERMFVVDAGGQQTYLTSRYYDEHTGDFAGKEMALYRLPGPTPMPAVPAYVADTFRLTAGATTVPVHYIEVFTQPLGSAALDDVYGVLGVDALDQLKAYTFDYRTMRFSVRPY